MPFAKRDLKKKLSKPVKVNRSLILLDGATDAVFNKDCRAISKESEGTNFPRAQETLDDLLGDVVLNGEGAQLSVQETLKDKHHYIFLHIDASSSLRGWPRRTQL